MFLPAVRFEPTVALYTPGNLTGPRGVIVFPDANKKYLALTPFDADTSSLKEVWVFGISYL